MFLFSSSFQGVENKPFECYKIDLTGLDNGFRLLVFANRDKTEVCR